MKKELALPESLKVASSPQAPLNMRLMLSSGVIPLGLPDQAGVLLRLEDDPDEKVRSNALESWAKMDDERLVKALSDKSLGGELLDVLAEKFQERPEVVEALLTHPNLGTETLARFLGTRDARLLDRISGNQRLLMQEPGLVRQLLKNPGLERSVAARLASLIGEALPEEEAQETAEPAGEEDVAESDAFSEDGEGVPEPPPELFADLPEEFSQEIPPELLADLDEQEVTALSNANESTNLYALIQNLSIAEKIKLATLGSKSARKLLARDSNRLVVTAVVRSPKIREDEITVLAQDRTMPDDVLVYIMSRKDWMKNYQIRFALCQNPKTPLPKALRLLDTLAGRELRSLAKSKNVSAAVSSAALRTLARKSQH